MKQTAYRTTETKHSTTAVFAPQLSLLRQVSTDWRVKLLPRRIYSKAIDALIVCGLWAVTDALSQTLQPPSHHLVEALVFWNSMPFAINLKQAFWLGPLVLFTVYEGILLAMFGQTLGQRIVDLKLKTTEPNTWVKVGLRVLYSNGLLCLSLLWPWLGLPVLLYQRQHFQQTQQTSWDEATQTSVVFSPNRSFEA